MYTFHTDEDVESDIVFISCGNMDVWDATSMGTVIVGLEIFPENYLEKKVVREKIIPSLSEKQSRINSYPSCVRVGRGLF